MMRSTVRIPHAAATDVWQSLYDHPDDRDVFQRSIRRSLRKGVNWQWEGRVTTGRGIRWLQVASRVRAAKEDGLLWDGVAVDVMMPGKYRGPELAVLARTVQPQIGIVRMPGYADQMSDLKSDSSAQRLVRLFSIRELGGAVHSALSATKQ